MSPKETGHRPRLSAVVVNHNAGDLLCDCVASLRRAGLREIVVVDNASVDGSLHRLAAADKEVDLVPTGANRGYGAAANVGVARTTGEYVLICNPDVVVDKSAPGLLAATLDAHDDAAIAGPRITEPDGGVYPSARAFPSLADGVGHAFIGLFSPNNRWTRKYRNDEVATDQEFVSDWVSGVCLLVRRVAFTSVGGFDERYFMYVEDLDLCWRLRRSGWQTRYVPAAVIVHKQGASSQDRPYRLLVAHHESTWRFVHRSLQGPERVLLPVIGAGIGVRLVLSLGRTFGERHRGRETNPG